MARNISFFLIAYILFFPTYLVAETANTGQILLFVSFPIVLFLVFVLTVGNVKHIEIPPLTLTLLVVGSLLFLTVVTKGQLLEVNLILNHVRFLIYAVVFALSYTLAKRIGLKLSDVEGILKGYAWLLLLFIAVQAVLPDSFIVSVQTKKALLDWTGFRIGSTLEWSYIYAFCVMPPLIVVLHKWLRSKASYDEIILAALLVITILLSQSKAAYLNVIFIIAVYILLSAAMFKKNKKLWQFALFVLVISASVIYLYGDYFVHIWTFLERISTGRLDSSTATRFEQLALLKYTWDNNLLFGYPIEQKTIENAYAHYFYVYGLIGLFAYLCFIALFNFDAFNRLRRAFYFHHGDYLGVAIAMFCLMLSVLIFALGASPTDANKAAYWFYCLYGLYCGSDDVSYSSRRLVS